MGAPMRMRALLYTPAGGPRFVLPAVLALVVTFVLGYAGMRLVQRALPASAQAAALSSTRKYGAAEAIYVRLLREKPSGEVVIALLENHQKAKAARRLRQLLGGGGFGEGAATDLAPDQVVMTEEVLDDLLERTLPPDLLRLARYWRGLDRGDVSAGLREEMILAANREPPAPWHNHALAREALGKGDAPEAARLFEREGLAFEERRVDLDRALLLWIRLEAWDHVRERLSDPRVAKGVDAEVKYKLAVHDRDWPGAARWLVLEWKPDPSLTTGLMAGVAALAWGLFCARLGKIGERPKRRLVFYLLAFALGVLSVVPTVLLIAVEEAKLRLVETGDAGRDLLFFVFGVGLREEASKLLLFLPLVPILRRWGDRLDVLVCGALVGLGFAAEENLNYLARGDLHTALARFLTANFMHMAMTGILAAALDDFLRDREKYAAEFSRATVMIVAMHGGYDFLATHEEMGGTYLAMGVFFFLVRMFLVAVDHARRKADVGFTLTHAFLVALAIVTGTSAVYAVAAVGPMQGAVVLAEGLLGVAILIYAFVRTLREM